MRLAMLATATARGTASTTAAYGVAGLSATAALIHLWVTPEHFGEWWGYGTFMLAAFVAQALYAGAVVLWPRWRLLLVSGIAGNLAIVGMWIFSRTIGVPLGPMSGTVETAGALDVICTAVEIGVVVLLSALLFGRLRQDTRGPTRFSDRGRSPL